MLHSAWSVLLPTPEERARALSNLLPHQASESSAISSGRKFMTDLLVSSLMTDGGLKTSLMAAIKLETKELEDRGEKETEEDKLERPGDTLMTEQAVLESETKRAAELSSSDEEKVTAIPLLYLIRQLLRNASHSTIRQLSSIAAEDVSELTFANPGTRTENSPSLQLLLKFQRLLVTELFIAGGGANEVSGECEAERRTEGILSLLRKYLHLICCHVLEIVPTATNIGNTSQNHFLLVGVALEQDLIGILLPELVISLLLLQMENQTLFAKVEIIPSLTCIMECVDKFNITAPGHEKEESDELYWPGFLHQQAAARTPEELPVIRKADLENHNKDGGLWIVIKGKVYDVQDWRSQLPPGSDSLIDFEIEDATQAYDTFKHSSIAKNLSTQFLVGNYCVPELEGILAVDPSSFTSPFIDLERNIGLFLGYHCNQLVRSTLVHADEKMCQQWMASEFLRGGIEALHTPNPYDDEKGEVTSHASAAVTPLSETEPGQTSFGYDSDPSGAKIITCLSEGNLSNQYVKIFMALLDRLSKQHMLPMQNMMQFPSDHPVEEVGRQLLAVLLKHLGLTSTVSEMIQLEIDCPGEQSRLTGALEDCLRAVHQTKWRIIRTRQEQVRSYKEVCAPVIERCKFLLVEVRPASCDEVTALERRPILFKESKFRQTVRHVIAHRRDKQRQPTADSININLRSQEGGLFAESEEECFKLKDIVNEELQGSMASDAVAMLSSSCEPSQSNDNDLLRRSFRGSRDQLLGSGEGLASSRERLIGSRDDMVSSMTSSRVMIPEESFSSSDIKLSDTGNVMLGVDLKDSEDEKEEVDDEAKDEDSKKNDAQDEKQSEDDECDSQYNMDKMSEDHFDDEEKDQEDVQTGQDDDKPDSPVSTPSPEIPKRLHRPNSLLDTPKHLPTSKSDVDAVKVAATKMVGQIVEFICDDNKVMNLDLLRRCMFLQVERFKIRMKGVKSITELLSQSDLISSVKYSMLNGWQSLIDHCSFRPGGGGGHGSVSQCLDMIEMLPSYDKAQLTLQYSKYVSLIIDY